MSELLHPTQNCGVAGSKIFDAIATVRDAMSYAEVKQDPLYRMSQEERTKLREGVSYVKLYRYSPKHLYPKLNGYGDNGKRSLKL